MKKRFYVLLITALIAFVGMTSCKKEIVKPNQIENNIVGDWDRVDNGTSDGVFNYKFYDNGEGVEIYNGNQLFHADGNPLTPANNEWELKYSINEDGTYQQDKWNYYIDGWSTTGTSAKTLSFPHKDTIVIAGDTYARM